MADATITSLQSIVTVSATDVLAIVDVSGPETRKATVAQLDDYLFNRSVTFGGAVTSTGNITASGGALIGNTLEVSGVSYLGGLIDVATGFESTGKLASESSAFVFNTDVSHDSLADIFTVSNNGTERLAVNGRGEVFSTEGFYVEDFGQTGFTSNSAGELSIRATSGLVSRWGLGGLVIRPNGSGTATTMRSREVDSTPLRVEGVVGQTADIFEVYDVSGGTQVMRVSASSQITFNGLIRRNSGTMQVFAPDGFFFYGTTGDNRAFTITRSDALNNILRVRDSSAVDRFVVDATGRVGIGNGVAPQRLLHVESSDTATTIASANTATILVENDAAAAVDRTAQIQFAHGNATTQMGMQYKGSGSGGLADLYFAVWNLGSLQDKMRLTSQGALWLDEIAAPSTPSAGKGAFYVSTSGVPRFINDAGTDFDLTTAAGGGDVTKVGTPADNQVGVWTGDGTLEGDADFTWDGTTLSVNGAGAQPIFVARDSGSDAFVVENGGSLRVAEIAEPATPASGFGRLYEKTDGRLYFKNDAGTEYDLTDTGGAGSVGVSGTPANDQIAVWVNATTIEGASGLTYNGTAFGVTGNITVTGTVDGRDVAADGSKLDGIEAGATANQTTEEIQDAAWSVLGGTQTLITVTYRDSTNDVDFVVDNNLANYNNAISGFISGINNEPLSDLSDVTIANIGANEILQWNGSAWINRTLAEAGIGTGNVSNTGTPANDQIAVWVNATTIEGTSGLTYNGASLGVTGNITVTGTVDGRDVAADGNKLDGIEAGATANQTTEEIQDAAWSVLGGTQTLITVTYQDSTNDVDFVVDNNLANYNNAISGFISDINNEPLSDLSDVTIANIGANEILQWNGSAWINRTLAEASIVSGTGANDRVAVFNGTNSVDSSTGLTFNGFELYVNGVLSLDNVDAPAPHSIRGKLFSFGFGCEPYWLESTSGYLTPYRLAGTEPQVAAHAIPFWGSAGSNQLSSDLGLVYNPTTDTLDVTDTINTTSVNLVYLNGVIASMGSWVTVNDDQYESGDFTVRTVADAAALFVDASANKVTLGVNSATTDFEIAGGVLPALFVDAALNRVGVNEGSPDATLHVADGNFPVALVERASTTATSYLGTIRNLHRTNGNMGEGFGSCVTFAIQDSTAGPFDIASVGAKRVNNSDNSGRLVLARYDAGFPTEFFHSSVIYTGFFANKTGIGDPEDFVLDVYNQYSGASVCSVLRLNIADPDPTKNSRYLLITKGGSSTNIGTVEGYIDQVGQYVNSLTVQHWAVYEAKEGGLLTDEIEPGMIVESTGRRGIHRGIESAIPVVTKARSSRSKRVFGVLSSSWDQRNTGHHMHFDGDYNTYSMREKPDPSDTCTYSDDSPFFKAQTNSGGEGMVWVTNIAGDIENGDYITSSDVAGYGELQDDDLLHSYTVAKCTEDVDWDAVTDTIEHEGAAYKRALVFCTYHCG